MGAAPGSGWEEGEFEFKLVFEEDPPRQSRRGPEESTDSGHTHPEPAGTSGQYVTEEDERILVYQMWSV